VIFSFQSLAQETSNRYSTYIGEGFPQIEAGTTGVSSASDEDEEDDSLILETVSSSFSVLNSSAWAAKKGDDIVSMSSCLDYINAGLGIGKNGVYQITNGGYTYPVFCNQTSFGGGFTLVAAQYEDFPVEWTGKNNGIENKMYDASLAFDIGFSLSSSQIPSHTSTGFSFEGTDGYNIPNYVNFNYTTGDISISNQDITNQNGTSYHISRSSTAYYLNHDPDGGSSSLVTSSTDSYRNTLTIDRVGMLGRDWAFSPLQNTKNHRGYYYGGISLSETYQAKGFFIWVR
jgi:hypothetical protein